MRLYIFFLFCLLSCHRSSNDRTAKVVVKSDNLYIQLTGKRKALIHDPVSAAKGKLIDDTLLLSIPFLKEGLIKGEQINVDSGYYRYSGFIVIKGDSLVVDLYLINTDDKKLEPESYNGRYYLEK